MKQCPFCGCEKVDVVRCEHTALELYFAECYKCEASGALAETREEAIEKWNDRFAKRYAYIYVKVFFAYLTNNVFGKRKDAHGRSYRQAFRKFGIKKMVGEYLDENTWLVK